MVKDENAPYPLIYKPMLFIIPWEISLRFLFREKKIKGDASLSLSIYTYLYVCIYVYIYIYIDVYMQHVKKKKK